MIPLTTLRDDVLSCRKCELSSREDQPVPGCGPAKARVFLLGERPSRDEMMLGRPFEERAGLVLKKLLRMAGLKHEDCYASYLVKCEGETGKGLPHCKAWLWEELRLVSPRVVVTLGAAATRLLLNLKSSARLEDVAGTFVEAPYLPGTLLAPWHSPVTMLSRGKAFSDRTVEFFTKVRVACESC
jgi:DNA polymerase